MDIKQLQRKMKDVKRRLDPKEIEREKNLEHAKGIMKGAAVGGIIASVTALFLSPDSGKNNRKKAKKELEKAKKELEKAKDALEANLTEGKEKLSQIYDNKKELIEEKKNLLKEKFSVEEDLNIIDELDLEEIIEEALDSDEY